MARDDTDIRERCQGPDCSRPASRPGGLCYGHYRQRRMGQPLRPLRPRGLKERIAAVVDAYLNAETAEEFERAYKRLWELVGRKERVCSVQGCGRRYYAQGLCYHHAVVTKKARDENPGPRT